MKKIAAAFVLLGFSLALVDPAISQTTMFGGKGLLRVQSAETVGRGNFYLNSFVLTFLDKASSGGLAKDHTWNMGLTLGFSSIFELTARLVPYQDDQAHIWGPPGDTELGFKMHWPLPSSVFHFGLQGFISFPTASKHNVDYEPYASGAVAWAAKALCTWDMTDTFPILPLQIHGNLGYIDQDIRDRYFRDKKDQALVGIGVKFPVGSAVLYTEYTAEVFFNNTEKVALSQNSMRVSQGLKFIGPWHLILDVAAEAGLSADPGKQTSPFLKDYAHWKIILGVTYRSSFLQYIDRSDEIERQRQDEETKKLEEIRRKREKANKELEEMKKLLEKEKKQEPGR